MVFYRSAIRSAFDPAKRTEHLSPLGGEMASNYLGDKIFIRSKTESFERSTENGNALDDDDTSVKQRMVTIDPKELIGSTLLKDSEEDGQRFRARIVRAVLENEDNTKKDPSYLKFVCEIPNSPVDEMYTYNEILDFIERDKNDIEKDTKHYTAHQVTLRTSDKDYKGSRYNVLVEWETGETTYEPLDLIASDDPVTCAQYAKKHGLLDTDGWKRFRRIVNKSPRIERLINQAKTSTYKHEPFWKFGYLVPQTHWQAMELDKKTEKISGKKQKQLRWGNC
jgi:hypothetical protein